MALWFTISPGEVISLVLVGLRYSVVETTTAWRLESWRSGALVVELQCSGAPPLAPGMPAPIGGLALDGRLDIQCPNAKYCCNSSSCTPLIVFSR